PAAVRGHGESGFGGAAGGEPRLRVTAQVADQNDFVNTSGCHIALHFTTTAVSRSQRFARRDFPCRFSELPPRQRAAAHSPAFRSAIMEAGRAIRLRKSLF